MTDGETHDAVAEAELAAFAQALADWSTRLPLAQQVLVHRLLHRAAAGVGDTAGFALDASRPLTGALVTALLPPALGATKLPGNPELATLTFKRGQT